MLRKALALVAAASGTILGAAACNPVTPYAAVVNGGSISQSAVQSEAAAILSDPTQVQNLAQQGTPVVGEGAGMFNTAFLARVLTRQIDFLAVSQELARRHLKVTPAEISAAAAALPQQFGPGEFGVLPRYYRQVLAVRSAELTLLEESLANADLTPAGLTALYESHRASFQTVCASRILVATQAAAAQAQADLNAGKSFAAVAAARSQDTNTASQGGQLGCEPGYLYEQSFGPQVGQAVETLPLNVPYPPISGPDGIAIYEVTARTSPAPDQVDSVVRQFLASQGEAAIGPLINDYLARAAISVDARYGAWTGKGGQDAVVPPSAPKVRSDARSPLGVNPTGGP